jgi:hypothetical protein
VVEKTDGASALAGAARQDRMVIAGFTEEKNFGRTGAGFPLREWHGENCGVLS